MSGDETEMAEPREALVELHDPATGDRYVSGWGLIWHAPEVPRDVIERVVIREHGDDWDHLIIEVQHLNRVPRVKNCSNYDGFGCDQEGEWHGHWFGVKHNPASDCCHVVVLPSWMPGIPLGQTPSGGDA